MDKEGLLPHLRELATAPHPDFLEQNPHPYILFSKPVSNTIL
jgi:hypothetical protein